VHRTVIQLLVMVAASGIMMGFVLLGGLLIPSRTPAVMLPTRLSESASRGPDVPDVCLEAPVTSPTGIAGQGTVCTQGQDVRATLTLSALTNGKEYTAWLGYAVPMLCRGTPCGPMDLPEAGPAGPMVRLGSGIAPSSRTMRLSGVLDGVRLVSGGQVSLTLLSPGGRAGPHAQANLVVP
jgi:hypothetical protein